MSMLSWYKIQGIDTIWENIPSVDSKKRVEGSFLAVQLKLVALLIIAFNAEVR